MQNLLQNELKKITQMRHIKNYKNMSREKILNALLKSKQSHAELYKSKSNNVEIEETKKIFNELRNKFSKSKIKEIRKKLYEKEKGLENEEKKVKKYQEEQEKKQHAKELKKIKKSLEKLKKYHDKDDQDYKGIRYIENLFNKIDEDYYKPIKTKDAFNNNYIEYESRGDKDKRLSVSEYLYMIIPYLENMINNYKAPIRDSNGIIIEDDLSGEWKIQLTMQISFISSLDTGEIRTIDSKSDNVEITMGNEADDIIKELFESFKKRYQEGLETKMKGSQFVFESVDLLYYSLHKTSLNRGWSYKDSPKWLKNKRARIHQNNKDNCHIE